MTPTDEQVKLEVENLASKFHNIYQQEARRQGDVRHKDAYADLPENIKEFDRVLARYVLELIAAHDAELAERVQRGVTDQLYAAISERVRRETLEEAAKTICVRCDEGLSIEFHEGKPFHVVGGERQHCYAWAIRAFASKEHHD